MLITWNLSNSHIVDDDAGIWIPSRSLSPEARVWSTGIMEPLLWGIRDLRCQWYPNHVGNSRRILINQNPLFYPMSWKKMHFSDYRPFAVYSNLSGPTPIFSSPQALFTSLSIFSAPHSHFYSRLINLLFFRLPWSDIDGHERGMRAEKKTSFLPSLSE